MHDLFPTLLGMTGIDPPDGVRVEAMPLPGTSVDGPKRAADDPIVGEFVGPPVEFINTMHEQFLGVDASRFNRTLVALRAGGLKIHWGSDGRHQLFDVVDDPGELRDLAAARDGRLDDMVHRVERWLSRPAWRDR